LTAGMYFSADTPDEDEIRMLADALYRRADWQWAQNRGPTVTHGWKPKRGFLKYRWSGYDEALLLYVLGLGSPTHPLPESSYTAWISTYQWEHCYGYEYLYAGPLFIHQLSHIWIDFRGIQDAFMREKGIDYFENSRRATYVQQQYAIDNPLKFKGYGRDCWGITASEGPGPKTMNVNGVKRRFFDYVERVRTGRRHHRTVGRGGVVAVRARNCVAHARLLYPRGQTDRVESIRIQSVLQSDLPGEIGQSPGLGIAMAFRAQSGPDHSDDRKLSHRNVVAIDAKLPIHRQRLVSGGVCWGLAMMSSVPMRALQAPTLAFGLAGQRMATSP